MAEIIIIVAIAKNYTIGKDGKIPWHIREDFLHFKNKTMGWPCIMGDVTYESLPIKPLPGRENVICTFNKDYHPEGTVVFHDFFKALEYVKEKEKAFIIGGASIYRLGMKVADTLEITHIKKEYDGDTFFPEIDPKVWEKVKEDDHGEYSFVTYNRKK